MEGPPGRQADRESRLSQVYLAIISRYKDYIEEKEGLSVAELPTLVTPNNEKVAQKSDEIKAGFLNYVYENNFIDASSRAYEFVRNEIDNITLPLQFWLTPAETLEFKMGDSMDKNILLCSILIRLGNPSAKVFVKMIENSRKVFVHFEFSDKVRLLGLENGIEEMADAAIKSKLDYFATTNHTKSLGVAGGMNENELERYFKKVDRLNKSLDGKVTIFRGAEVDILKSGSLDLSKECLKTMDCVVASVHSNFRMPEQEMTKRVVKALDSGLVHILGHPTGRQINRRKVRYFDSSLVISLSGSVLMTRSFVIQPRLAVPTPYFRKENCAAACASLSIENFTL